jgi:hypothetical protein
VNGKVCVCACVCVCGLGEGLRMDEKVGGRFEAGRKAKGHMFSKLSSKKKIYIYIVTKKFAYFKLYPYITIFFFFFFIGLCCHVEISCYTRMLAPKMCVWVQFHTYIFI